MTRPRGRPKKYPDETQQPALVALRLPRPLEARLRHEAREQGRTLTDMLRAALLAHWDHPTAAADLVAARVQLTRLERRYARLAQRYKAVKEERSRLTKALDLAEWGNRLLGEELTVFKAEHPDVAEAIARRYARVQQEAQRRLLTDMQEALDRQMAALTGQASSESALVKALRKVVHPDKWSQGQPATALAHELMVRLNQ